MRNRKCTEVLYSKSGSQGWVATRVGPKDGLPLKVALRSIRLYWIEKWRVTTKFNFLTYKVFMSFYILVAGLEFWSHLKGTMKYLITQGSR